MPGGHHTDRVRYAECFFLIVCDKNRGHIGLLLKCSQFRPELIAEVPIEIREWFVEEQYIRFDYESPRECDPLLLSAGESRGFAVPLGFGQPDPVEHRLDPPNPLDRRDTANIQSEGHILAHGEMRKQGVLLEDHARVPGFRGAGRHIAASQEYATGGRGQVATQ
jgi:hypothetical protein